MIGIGVRYGGGNIVATQDFARFVIGHYHIVEATYQQTIKVISKAILDYKGNLTLGSTTVSCGNVFHS
jgi:hypothetical protein